MQSPNYSYINLALTQDLHTATLLGSNCSHGMITPDQCCDFCEHLVGVDGLASNQYGPKVFIERPGGFTKDIAQEDPFGFSPIIRRITKEAKLKSKRAHAGRNISRVHICKKSLDDRGNTGTPNQNGKRRASLTGTSENTQGESWRCPALPGAMNLRSWNCQGLGNPWTVEALQCLVCNEDPKIVFLCEGRCSGNVMKPVRLKFGFRQCIMVESNEASGGLCLLWTDELVVSLRTSPFMGPIDKAGSNKFTALVVLW
ncbi:hypothetical protein L3X38_016849 [Prunus dulcis]|uniref:Uncharacterized protein n=1 Tax=Prunus dulcis TaxID=3755 RepID=A0AAD4W652_PRUDU|nr:hypothetical protein L3X38_016849 [Prunus dulcis]